MMTKLTTVKRKANVGEQILITDATITGGKYATGNVLTVKKHCPAIYDLIYANGVPQPIHTDEYVIVEDYATDRRLTEAEAKIKTLEAEVKALKTAQKPTTVVVNSCEARVRADDDIDRIATALVKVIKTEQQTPNQANANSRRADVIKRAQAFVADLLTEIDDQTNWRITAIPAYQKYGRLRVEFEVNNEKRTVVALARLGNFPKDGTVYAKGVAKCAPDDVFNADLGKAIALGRALGVKVPAEFYNAPQPDRVVAGMEIITYNLNGSINPYCPTTAAGRTKQGYPRFANGSYSSGYAIKDDTEAKYAS